MVEIALPATSARLLTWPPPRSRFGRASRDWAWAAWGGILAAVVLGKTYWNFRVRFRTSSPSNSTQLRGMQHARQVDGPVPGFLVFVFVLWTFMTSTAKPAAWGSGSID